MEIKHIAPGEDFASARQVREEVFVKEQGFQRRSEFDAQDPLAHHVVLYKDKVPVATSRFFPDPEKEGRYKIGRIAVLKEHRQGGTGRFLMRITEEIGKKLGATSFWLDAQIRVQGFYEALGYKVIGTEHLDEHVPHIEMEKEV